MTPPTLHPEEPMTEPSLSVEQLADLERIVREMTPAPWSDDAARGTLNPEIATKYLASVAKPGLGYRALRVVFVPFDDDPYDHLAVAITGNGPKGEINAAGIAALRNAAPSLLAMASAYAALKQRLVEWERAKSEMDEVDTDDEAAAKAAMVRDYRASESLLAAIRGKEQGQ